MMFLSGVARKKEDHNLKKIKLQNLVKKIKMSNQQDNLKIKNS